MKLKQVMLFAFLLLGFGSLAQDIIGGDNYYLNPKKAFVIKRAATHIYLNKIYKYTDYTNYLLISKKLK